MAGKATTDNKKGRGRGGDVDKNTGIFDVDKNTVKERHNKYIILVEIVTAGSTVCKIKFHNPLL